MGLLPDVRKEFSLNGCFERVIDLAKRLKGITQSAQDQASGFPLCQKTTDGDHNVR